MVSSPSSASMVSSESWIGIPVGGIYVDCRGC
jgi:hypothetical protein